MAGILDVLVGPVADLASRFIKDPNKKMEFDLELARLAQESEQRVHEEALAQIEVNRTEAQSGSVFVAGWRPFIGWGSGCAFIYSTILYPTIEYFGGQGPKLDNELLLYTLGGMLGIGAMRTYEKIKGVSTNDFRSLPSDPQSTPAPSITPIASPTIKKPKHFKIF